MAVEEARLSNRILLAGRLSLFRKGFRAERVLKLAGAAVAKDPALEHATAAEVAAAAATSVEGEEFASGELAVMERIIEGKAALPPLLRFVTATSLTRTGRCSFIFMFTGKMPGEWLAQSGYWGFAWLEAKGDDYLNRWEMGKAWRGEPHGQIVGDDGTSRWSVHVFESGRGEVLSSGFDDSADLGGWRSLVSEDILPPVSVFCVERALFDRLEPVLAEMGVGVEAHHHDGELATS